MTNNIMLEYIKITQKEILEYMKLIFGNQYSNKLALRYMDAYLNVRFYNFYPKDNNLPFRKNYLNAIKEEEASILRSMPEKQKLVEHMGLFFYYILIYGHLIQIHMGNLLLLDQKNNLERLFVLQYLKI